MQQQCRCRYLPDVYHVARVECAIGSPASMATSNHLYRQREGQAARRRAWVVLDSARWQHKHQTVSYAASC